MNKLIEVRDLHVSLKTCHRTVHALRGINFDLYQDEKLGIVGESGSGKSILMKSILQLLPPSSCIEKGTILYQGKDLLGMSDKKLQTIRGKEIGMVFQDPMTALNPTMQIGLQIVEGYKTHFPACFQEAKKWALKLIEEVGMNEPNLRFHQFPHQLSGGLRQRALIAIALAAKPYILIADEPTTALDVTVQAQILELLKKLQNHKSTILVTHDLSLVAAFCNRVLVMYAGQVVEEAEIHELFHNPKHPYTKRLLQAIPRLDHNQERLISIGGNSTDLAAPSEGCCFCPRCADAMHICKDQTPPFFTHQDHKTRCWLYDPRRSDL